MQLSHYVTSKQNWFCSSFCFLLWSKYSISKDFSSKVWILYQVISERWTSDQLKTLFNISIIKIRLPLSNVLIRGESTLDDKCVERVFNLSGVHLSEMTCYKIHTLMVRITLFTWNWQLNIFGFGRLFFHEISIGLLHLFHFSVRTFKNY